MKNTHIFALLFLCFSLSLTACGDEKASETDKPDTATAASATNAAPEGTGNATALPPVEETTDPEAAAAEVMAGKGPMSAEEYNRFLGFDMEGYTWKEKYRNQASTKGVYMVTGTYSDGQGVYIDVELEGCDSDHCVKPSLKKFEKYYRNLGTKAKFWEEELGGRAVYFYSLDDAWDNKHTLTIAGTSYQRESRYMVKAIEVVAGDGELATRKETLKGEIRKVFENLPG